MDIPKRCNGFTGCKPPGNLHHLLLSHTEYKKICRSISKDCLPDAILPVIIMGKPSETCLDPPENNRCFREQFMDPVGVNNGCPIWSSGDPAGEYTSSLRRFRLGVKLFTMESTFPEDIPKNNLGFPNSVKSAEVFQSGCAMIPTVKPASHRTLPISAVPKEG